MENIEWLRDILYIIPIAALIWKAAILSAKVRENETAIKEIKTLVQRQNEAILTSLDKMNTVMIEIQQDVAILKALRGEEKENAK